MVTYAKLSLEATLFLSMAAFDILAVNATRACQFVGQITVGELSPRSKARVGGGGL